MKGKQIKIRGEEGIFFLNTEEQPIEIDEDGYLATTKFTRPYKLLIVATKVIDGKRKYKRRVLRFERTTSLRTALRVAVEERIEILKRIGTDEDRRKLDQRLKKEISLNEAFESYIIKRKVKEKTRYDYIKFYDKHLRHTIGYKLLGEIDSYDVQNVIDNLALKGYSKRTLVYVYNVLNPLFKHYKTLRYIDDNPCDYIQKFGKIDNEVEIRLTDRQRRSLLQAIDNYPIEPFRGVFVFLSTGRRLSEVLRLEWKHIDFEEGYYVIPKENSKSSKELIYPLTPELKEALEAQYKRGKYVFSAVTDPNRPLNAGTLKRHWRRVLDEAGIEKFRIHDLRHLIGNTLISHGYTLEEIATILGHSSISVTKRYAKAELESKRRILEGFKKIVE